MVIRPTVVRRVALGCAGPGAEGGLVEVTIEGGAFDAEHAGDLVDSVVRFNLRIVGVTGSVELSPFHSG